ncbi:MAG: hypothetical protein WCG87_00945 [Bacteroidota bacterium]
MQRNLTTIFTAVKKGTAITLVALSALALNANAQDTEFKPSGKLWGYGFADFAVKTHTDSLNRGGSNQYTGVREGNSMFQFRRLYLGYDYNISEKFSAEFLLAAEDNIVPTIYKNTKGLDSAGAASGDLLTNGKFSPYIKLANIRWKGIWKGTDLVFGQVATPSFPMMSEAIWGYRSIERTVSDIRRTPSFDFGTTLQGKFYNTKDMEFGYNVMVGNGQSAKPENDQFKWFYGDVYAKVFDKHLIIDLYQDYQRINWTPTWHHDRNMTKLFLAYNGPKLTIGFEGFVNTLMGDIKATGTDGKTYYRTTNAYAFSLFTRGRIYKDKLGFFARYDKYDPSGNISAVTGTGTAFTSYSALTSQYDPKTRENFVTAGIDFTPVKNVHIMPNIWYNNYDNASATKYTSNAASNYDLVARLTIYYIYGK